MSLTELANGDCTFLQNEDGQRGCKIYAVRPAQCRNWPFWGQNLVSQSAWNRAGQRCCGINKGEFHSFEKIEKERRLTTKARRTRR